MREAFDAKGYDASDVVVMIRRYSKEELDISRSPSSQEHAIRSIQRKIEEKFVGMFEGDSGSALDIMVRRYIMRLHTNTRTTLRAKGRLKDSSCDGSNDDSGDEDNEKDSDIEFVVVPAVVTELPRENSQTPVVASSTSYVAATSTSKPVRASERRFSSQSLRQSSSSSASQPRTAPRDTAPSCSSLARNQDVAAVERFLDSCLPSMGHFLDRFLSYGCQNPQFILAVSNLPRNSIIEFLRSLPCLGGRIMSEMEVFLLTENFLRYSQ